MQQHYVERDATEAVVAAQWSRVLGHPPASLDTDFFAAGGTSLLAAKLVSALRGALGTQLPLKAVFEAPTFRGLSTRIREGGSSPHTRVLTLNAFGRGTPLLLVPAASGGVVGLHRLGGAPIDRPVLGLQARGLDPADGAPCATLDDIVDDFATVLEKAEAPRSLHLAGYCVGGILAYELACELDRRGWDVRSVVLLNTSLYCPPLEAADGAREKLRSIVDEAGLTVPEGEEPDTVSVFRLLTSDDADTLESDFAQFEARLKVFGSVGAAISGYVPRQVVFPVRLFSTDDRDDPADVERTPHEVTDWPDLGLPDFWQHHVPVDHFEMIAHEPTLRAVEEVLTELDDR
ncbi:thioesterase domain-containing protein [Streptomyces sp. NPDC017936]|uniref:thioesterase domain-containing protein n=1 Tax=Streptomyces sp. NPDC017936 TaxID=3365016 RepID=UPI0037AF5767